MFVGLSIPVRYVQVSLMFSAFVLTFHQRSNVSEVVVVLTTKNGTHAKYLSPVIALLIKGYSLRPHEKSSILGSIFWGALLVQVPSGYLGSAYGTMKLMFCSIFLSSLASIILPLCLIYGNSVAFIALRAVQGCAQGLIFPTVYGHLAKWCPLNERSLLGGISLSGLDLGMALGLMNSGFLAVTPLHWPSAFYLPGLAGLVWCIFWLLYGAESPHNCKYITVSELNLLETKGTWSIRERRTAAVPWCAIVTSVPYLVLVFNKICQALCIATLTLQIPAYLNAFYAYEVHINAFISALPFFALLLSTYLVTFTAHYLLKVRKVSLTVLRKSLNSISNWVPAATLSTMSLLKKENMLANIMCIVIGVASNSTISIGSSLNHIDLSPNFAALLFGITGSFIMLSAIVSPIIVAEIVTDENNPWKWNIIFLGLAALLFVSNLLYLFFGQMVAQPWDELHSKNAANTKKASIDNASE